MWRKDKEKVRENDGMMQRRARIREGLDRKGSKGGEGEREREGKTRGRGTRCLAICVIEL